MRRALALAAAIALTAATAASAETWKKYADGESGTEWSYDTDYSYKDQASGRVVVMKAISKPSAGFAAAGPPKGVGFVEAIDCKEKNALQMATYKPSTGLVNNEDWRHTTPKGVDAPLAAAVCPGADKLPVK